MATASPESPHSINKRPKDDVSDDEKDDEKSQKTMAMVRCRILGPVDDTLKLQHGPVPIIKNATDVLIQVLFASINPIDWKISTGKMGPLNPLKPPFNAGSDFSGRVVAKGKDAGDNVAVGDLVYGQSWTIDGSFAEFCICRGSDVRKAPESMSALEASAMPMVCLTSYQALLTAKLQKGQKLLILGGTTSTGMAAIQIAKCAPFEAAEIIVTSSREELCKELGADRVINYKNETWTESLRDYGVDCIYDCVGGQDSWDLCRKEGVLKKDGHYVTIVGDAKGGKQNTYGTMLGMGASIVNRKFWGAVGGAKYDLIVCDPTKNLDDITKLIDGGQLKAKLDPDSPFAFDDWRAMYTKSMEGKARGKLVMQISSVEVKPEQKATKRILMMVTNTASFVKAGDEKEEVKTGFYIPEIAHPWAVFKAAGYEMTYVSRLGGDAPVDPSSIAGYTDDAECKAFQAGVMGGKDTLATVQIGDVEGAAKFDAIFYVGGVGVLWDFADDKVAASTTAELYEKGGLVGAVCHGPAALINVQLSNGKALVEGKTVTGFTNEEEEASGLTQTVPFLLETALKEKGAQFTSVAVWAANVEVSERVFTGQNPASASGVAKKMVEALSK